MPYSRAHRRLRQPACDTETVTLKSFDFVVTNPPYIGHKAVDPSYMRLLKMFYSDVYFDKADVSYCFFKLGCDLLKHNGRLIYVTSRYFAESLYASRLRKYLLENFRFVKIVDFYGVRPFKSIGIDPMIVFLRKGKTKGTCFQVIKPQPGTHYFDVRAENNACIFSMRQDDLLEDGFNLHDNKQRHVLEKIAGKCPLRLEDVAGTFQGVISGADSAFIVSGKDNVYKKCIRECGVKWIKSKDIGAGEISGHGVYLLYTNGRDHRKLKHTLKKIEPYRELLEKRRECKKGIRQWYELQWPRRKEQFENKKIVFPYKCDRNKFVVDESDYYFSADIYAISIKKPFLAAVSYEKLALYLNSTVCEYYFKSYAKKLGGGLYEYYPNTVKKIALPPLGALENFETEQDILAYFALTKEELSD
jgi:adenine-specific DNA-methyltransferase